MNYSGIYEAVILCQLLFSPGVPDKFFTVRSTGICMQGQIVANAHFAYARSYNMFDKLERDSMHHICGKDLKGCPWIGPR